MSIPRIMIAAPKSGSGKTLITCSLLWALKKMNMDVCAFKCGPDYIDPMFHREVIGIPSENLDTFFTGESKTRDIFEGFSSDHDIAVIEGVMGLFDGVGGISEIASSYHLAYVTDTPVILLVDAHGMGRSIIPLIEGMLSYDRKKLIKGIILNRISKSFYEVISKALIETLTENEHDVKLLGYFEKRDELSVSGRHLGLKLPAEIEDIKDKLETGADYIKKTVDIKELISIAGSFVDNENYKKSDNYRTDLPDPDNSKAKKKEFTGKDICNFGITLAVARDEAFCFYYDANIRMFKERGVSIKYFSPLHDKKLPRDADGILLGGGYPELYAKELSNNKTMLSSIKNAIKEGVPSLAECGGFMYLHRELEDDNGRTYALANVIDEKVTYTGKPVRFGYVELSDKENRFLSDGYKIKGHEFHYYDSTGNGTDVCAVKPLTGRSWDCCYVGENHWWGFPHLYYPSCPDFVDEFIKMMTKRK